jgi:uncharacterized delta-60 repeat protein
MKHTYFIIFTFVTHFALARLVRAQTYDNFYPAANGNIAAIAVQPDGKIWIGGDFTTLDDMASQGLARLNADGSMDLAFDPGAATQDHAYTPLIVGVAIQPDLKVVAAGWFTSFGGFVHTNVVRLNANGTVDASYNPTFVRDYVAGLAMQADGKILVPSGTNVFRINADGTHDTSFNVFANDPIDMVAIQPDGKILLSGAFSSVNGVTHAYLARVNTNGILDSSFNYYQTAYNYYRPNEVASVVVQPDGKIVIGAEHWVVAYPGTPYQYYYQVPDTFRITSTGALDIRMGSSGFDYALAIQADGKILAGSSPIYRLNPAGTNDPGFVPTGYANTMAIQPDGNLLFGGPLGRFINTDAATQSLSLSGSTITWLRGGTSPEVWRTTFEYSADHGSTWTNLGFGTRINGGWQETSGVVPADATIRARGFVGGGDSSSWFVESLLNLAPLNPVILTDDGHFGILSNIFGFNLTGQSGQIVVTEGSTDLTGWTPLQTNTLGPVPLYFRDPNWTNFPTRFYRARLQ